MPTIEGYSFSSTIIALDSTGGAANAARSANSLYASWFFHNSSNHDVQLTFPKGQLFDLKLLDDQNNLLWESAVPPPIADYSVTVPAGGNFSVPDSADPNVVRNQVPVVPLAQLVAGQHVPAATELYLAVSIPLFGDQQRIVTRLWRAPAALLARETKKSTKAR